MYGRGFGFFQDYPRTQILIEILTKFISISVLYLQVSKGKKKNSGQIGHKWGKLWK